MATPIPGRHFARNLIQGKTLIYQLVKRDFQARYVGSAAGWVWSIIQPLVLLASYVFIFQYCLGQSLSGELTANYPLYLFSGMLPWLLFSETVNRSAATVVDHANLITKTLFPSEILPVAIYLSSLISHVMVTALVVVVAGILQGHLNPALVLLAVYVPILGMFAVGIGWIAAALHVYLRDTAQVVTVVMTFWFWLTPIFIQESRFREVQWVIWWNPMTYVVRGYRMMLLGQHFPAAREIAAATCFAVVTFAAGGMFFRSLKKGFGDVL